jgi:hypothetical protein
MDDYQRFQREVRQNFRWNFIVNTLDVSIYTFGISFVTTETTLIAFLHHLTSSSIIIGLFLSSGLLVNTLPQIFIAKHVERLSIKKNFILIFGFGERVYWLLLAITAFYLYETPMLCLTFFFIIYMAGNLSTGIATVPWLDMIAKVMGERRGFSSDLVGF